MFVEKILNDLHTRNQLFDWLIENPDTAVMGTGQATSSTLPLPSNHGVHLIVGRTADGPAIVELDPDVTPHARKIHRKVAGNWTVSRGPVEFGHSLGDTGLRELAPWRVIDHKGTILLPQKATGESPSEALARVIANPQDRSARVAYADALGVGRQAQLIHNQLNTNKAKPEQTRDLLCTQRAEVMADYVGLIESVEFSGGFPVYIRVDAKGFLDNADQLFNWSPIRDVSFKNAAAHIDAIFALPQLSRLRSIYLDSNGLTDAHVLTIAKSSQLANLTWLGLQNNRINIVGLDALAGSKSMPRLRWLGLYNNPAEDPVPRLLMDGLAVVGEETPAIYHELVRRYGKKAWLAAVEGVPARDAFNGGL
jgi:hypothetical protein